MTILGVLGAGMGRHRSDDGHRDGRVGGVDVQRDSRRLAGCDRVRARLRFRYFGRNRQRRADCPCRNTADLPTLAMATFIYGLGHFGLVPEDTIFEQRAVLKPVFRHLRSGGVADRAEQHLRAR